MKVIPLSLPKISTSMEKSGLLSALKVLPMYLRVLLTATEEPLKILKSAVAIA